jgi:hypothetical protein
MINSVLQWIDLSTNCIGAKGAEFIADGIRLNSALQEINLSGNDIGAEGSKYLADAIKLDSMLLHFELVNNKIGAEGAKYFAEAIKVNSALQKIHLYCNRSQISCRCDIKVNSTMEGIYLEEYNNIGDDEIASHIGEKSKENILRKEANYRKFICAFTDDKVESVRLGFDEMILRFVYYRVMGMQLNN